MVHGFAGFIHSVMENRNCEFSVMLGLVKMFICCECKGTSKIDSFASSSLCI